MTVSSLKLRLKKIFSPRRVAIGFILLLMAIFLSAPDSYLPSVQNGLNLYVVSVLPSMLPFFFFSKLLTELNFAQSSGKLLKKPLRFLFNAPPVSGYILLMSMLCGYPVGAKLVGEFFDSGVLSKEEAKKVASFTSTSGPLFIVGAVGVGMFGDKKIGFILLLSHYIGTFLNGLVFRGKKLDEKPSLVPLSNADDILNKSMLNTFLSVGLVGGYITVFNLFIDVCTNVGLIPLLVNGMEWLNVDGKITSGVAGGLLEMTKGCLTLSKSGFPHLVILPLCEFLITFGGLCVTLQSLTFLSKTKISPAYYFLTKFTQGILCSLICFLLCLTIF